jgi:hypothetical protein
MMAESHRVAAARDLLARLGVTVNDLAGQADVPPVAPTVGEYLPKVIAAAGPGAARTYGPYWARMAVAWGNRPLDTIAATDVEALQRACAGTAVARRNGRGGRHAGEHVIAAARALFNRAVADGLIAIGSSPAHQVSKPRRLPSTRRALTPGELAAINAAARESGNDVVLDALFCGCTPRRRAAAVARWRARPAPDRPRPRQRTGAVARER